MVVHVHEGTKGELTTGMLVGGADRVLDTQPEIHI